MSFEVIVVVSVRLCEVLADSGLIVIWPITGSVNCYACQRHSSLEHGIFLIAAAGTRPGFDYVDGDDLVKLKCIVLVSH